MVRRWRACSRSWAGSRSPSSTRRRRRTRRTSAAAPSLAQVLLGPGVAEAEIVVAAEAAGGSPLFVAELTRALRDGRGRGGVASLAEVLSARIDRLAPDARVFLDLVALAGRPIDESVV